MASGLRSARRPWFQSSRRQWYNYWGEVKRHVAPSEGRGAGEVRIARDDRDPPLALQGLKVDGGVDEPGLA